MPTQSFSVENIWQPSQHLPAGDVLKAIAARLGEAWGMSDLADRVQIAYNPRMRTTLGRAILDDLRVELNTRLLLENPEELVAVLAHELAHVVVHVRYGEAASPHGHQWQTLIRAVNMSPSRTHGLKVKRRRRRRYLYLHICSDCGYSFMSRSVRRDYYCVSCGPEMVWEMFRAPNTAEGRRKLKEMASAVTA